MAKADTIVDEAHKLWELQEFAQAACLFLEAAEIEEEEASNRSKFAASNSSISYRLRAGFCLFEEGKIDEALDILKEAIDFDWKSARLWADRRDAEKVHVCYLLTYANRSDVENYKLHADLAVKDGERLQIEFPWSTPVKKKAIMAAIAMEDHAHLSQWLSAMDPKVRKKDPELGLLCSQAEVMVANKTLQRTRKDRAAEL
jgi:tetratricopeptide (TPR) repeat protein